MPHPFACVIIFDQLGPERRDVAQQIIRDNSTAWWHYMPNVWIANGQDPSFWLEHLTPVAKETVSTVLVLSLPLDPEERAWGLFGPDGQEKARWFFRDYTGRPS